MTNSKLVSSSVDGLLGFLHDGMSIGAGGFGLCGIPENLIDVVAKSGIRDITIVGNNAGVDGFGMGRLIDQGQVRKVIASYVGENRELERQMLNHQIEVELVPQGTLAERLRAGGAGIGGFYTPTGVGTLLTEGRPTRSFGDVEHVLEESIRVDLAIVKAWLGDPAGNLVYRHTACNFNPLVATAGRTTVAEVEHLQTVGSIDPDRVHTPGIYVDRVVQGSDYEKRIEFRRFADEHVALDPGREWMVRRAAEELHDGDYVNLGIGMPTLVANFIPRSVSVTLHSENGLLGMGGFPTRKEIDSDLINAGKQSVTYVPGASTFSSAESFAMIRGGHIDVAILGGFEVATNGDLANWVVPGSRVKGPGGAMDLVSGVRRVIVLMDHVSKNGTPKLVESCSLPLTGRAVAGRVITDLGVFDVTREPFFSVATLAPGVTLDEVKSKTGAEVRLS